MCLEVSIPRSKQPTHASLSHFGLLFATLFYLGKLLLSGLFMVGGGTYTLLYYLYAFITIEYYGGIQNFKTIGRLF